MDQQECLSADSVVAPRPPCPGSVVVNTFDRREFRNALGRFATGVTVITACGINGRPIGLTANSFSSVSLDPPLVLWSLAKTSFNAPHFLAASHFAVHVLAYDQRWVADRFASRAGERFEGLPFTLSEEGVPVLAGCMARFECRTADIVDGGDHHIFLATPIAIECSTDHAEPLIFHCGGYASLR